MRPLAMAVVLFAALVLTGCGLGSDVRDFVDETYALQNTSGDTATYSSAGPVDATTAAIVGAVVPAARAADTGSEYLRYADDIVIVSAAPGGSTVTVEDLGGRYRNGAFAYLGPGFGPGAPGVDDDGGPGDGK